jgi:hypothetical protein
MHPFKQGRVDELTYTGNGAQVASKQKSSTSPGTEKSDAETKVMLDLFLNPPRTKGKVIKDVFQATKPQDATAQRIEQKKAKETAPAISKKEAYVESVNRALASLVAFGMYESGDEKIIFLERGKEVLLVRKGDRINGKYFVENITDQRVVLKAEKINEPVYIDISGL